MQTSPACRCLQQSPRLPRPFGSTGAHQSHRAASYMFAAPETIQRRHHAVPSPGCGLQLLRPALVRRPSAARLPPSALPVEALEAQQPLFEFSEGLETPVQLVYLLTLLGFLVVGAYLVVRQVLIRRDLEEAAKVLGDRIRSGAEDSEDCFQLGVILLRKKLYTQACKNLEKAKKKWTGDPEELAQVHNALGFAYFNMQKYDLAIAEYKQAVEKQPGYVTALNNLGDALEKDQRQQEALEAYQEALNYAPTNKVAAARVEALRARL